MNVQKAKIIDLNADYAVVLTDSGAFERIIRKANMTVGGGIYITEHDLYLKKGASKLFNLPVFSKRLLQVTGVMALLLVILFTQNVAPMSYAVISVDINPSVQLFIDADYNVVKIESMNAEGKTLLSEYDFVKKKSASKVLTELFALAAQMDYLKSDQNEILVAAAIYKPTKDDENKLQVGSDVETLIDTVLSEVDYSIFERENVVINAVASNSESIKAAEKEHLTIGQYEMDHHSDTVKPYVIVEDGKHIKTIEDPENANTPPDTSNEGLENQGDKVNNPNDDNGEGNHNNNFNPEEPNDGNNWNKPNNDHFNGNDGMNNNDNNNSINGNDINNDNNTTNHTNYENNDTDHNNDNFNDNGQNDNNQDDNDQNDNNQNDNNQDDDDQNDNNQNDNDQNDDDEDGNENNNNHNNNNNDNNNNDDSNDEDDHYNNNGNNNKDSGSENNTYNGKSSKYDIRPNLNINTIKSNVENNMRFKNNK